MGAGMIPAMPPTAVGGKDAAWDHSGIPVQGCDPAETSEQPSQGGWERRWGRCRLCAARSCLCPSDPTTCSPWANPCLALPIASQGQHTGESWEVLFLLGMTKYEGSIM